MTPIELYVQESNRIEGAADKPGHPEFDTHVQTAEFVLERAKRGQLVTPLQIGHLLHRPNLTYRESWTKMDIGDKRMPKSSYVPYLMDRWIEAWWRFDHYLDHAPEPYWKQWVELMAQRFHDWFLCIHPYEDWNGRIARLLYNSFVVRAGFGWRIFAYNEQAEYYEQIGVFEDTFFTQWLNFWLKDIESETEYLEHES